MDNVKPELNELESFVLKLTYNNKLDMETIFDSLFWKFVYEGNGKSISRRNVNKIMESLIKRNLVAVEGDFFESKIQIQ